jgi:hypothetical protein
VNHFDRIIVINLISRPDRRADMGRELARIGWPGHRIIWYPAIDPHAAAGFPNAGLSGLLLKPFGGPQLGPECRISGRADP